MGLGEEQTNFISQDKTFDPLDSNLYHLLFLWDKEQVKFAVIDPSTDVVLVIGNSKRHSKESDINFLNRLLVDFDFLKREYKSVYLSYSGGNKCLVPIQFYDEKNAQSLLSFSSGNKAKDFKTFKHSKLGAIMITESMDQEEWFKKHFPNIKIYPNSSLLIESLMRKNKFDKRNIVCVDVSPKGFDLFVFAKGKFVLNNSFVAENENDFTYYILNSIQQLNLNPENTYIQLSGDINKDESKFTVLESCFEKVQFNDSLYTPDFALGIDKSKTQEFSSLYNLYSCAS